MKFSVIIPAYKAAGFISRCLESALKQDFPKDEFEVIVVDDASPDNQNDIIEEYCTLYPNLRLIKHTDNKRQGGARNTGIDKAKGDYILFIDADDWWTRCDVLTTFNEVLKSKPYDIIEAVDNLREQNAYKSMDCVGSGWSVVGDYQPEAYFASEHGHFYVWLNCYKRELIKNINFREKVIFEDGDWKLKVCFAAKDICLIDFNYYYYYNNPESTIRGGNLNVFYANIDVNNVMLTYVLENFKGQARDAMLKKILNNIHSFLKISKNYKILESVKVLHYAASTPLLDCSNYPLIMKDKIVLNALKKIPFLTIASIKVAVLTRRKIRTLFGIRYE